MYVYSLHGIMYVQKSQGNNKTRGVDQDMPNRHSDFPTACVIKAV